MEKDAAKVKINLNLNLGESQALAQLLKLATNEDFFKIWFEEQAQVNLKSAFDKMRAPLEEAGLVTRF